MTIKEREIFSDNLFTTVKNYTNTLKASCLDVIICNNCIQNLIKEHTYIYEGPFITQTKQSN